MLGVHSLEIVPGTPQSWTWGIWQWATLSVNNITVGHRPISVHLITGASVATS